MFMRELDDTAASGQPRRQGKTFLALNPRARLVLVDGLTHRAPHAIPA
jgi:hypothetical protein